MNLPVLQKTVSLEVILKRADKLEFFSADFCRSNTQNSDVVPSSQL